MNETEKKTVPAHKPGEAVFAALLFAAGLFFLVQSLKLWFSLDEPRISSAAALPLFVSGLWTVLTLAELIKCVRVKPCSKSGGKSGGLSYAFPLELVVMLCAVAAYCALLLWGVSFYIVTPAFLYGGMCFLTRGGYLKNLLWTGVVMAFVVCVFGLLFGVVFP